MENNIMSSDDRDDDAREIRKDAAQLAKERKGSDHPRNGEENDYYRKENNKKIKIFIANYSKGLRHFPITDTIRAGEVDPTEYTHLKDGNFDKINFVHTMDPVKLTNPRSGRAFDLEGPDSHDMGIRAPPRIDSAEGAGEMAELYWMTLCRDIPFRNYNIDPMIANAVSDLNSNTNYTDFPQVQVGLLTDTDIGDDIGDKIFAKKFEIPTEARNISDATIFRGFTKGDLKGPYISQFLWKDIPLGTLLIEQIQFELNKYGIDTDGDGINDKEIVQDYLTDYPRWLLIQDGFKPPDFMMDDTNKKLKRHIISGRDITYYVHRDQLYQAYLNACLILLGKDYPFTTDCPFDPLLPYQDQNPNEFHNELGFITFGGPHILSLVAEVATRAGKAIWYQKWFQHRRLRPEAFGGLIHRQLNNRTFPTPPPPPPLTQGLSEPPEPYPISDEILGKTAPNQILDRILKHNKEQNNRFPGRDDLHGSYLLPQAFPEGSPTHPSYGSGHATVAGACVTVLKAFFDEDAEILNPVIPKQIVPPNQPRKVLDSNGNIIFEITTELESYTSPPGEELKVGEELNKLAANISIGRNWAGVHYRSDYTESVLLGEQIALGILQEQAKTYKREEKFACTLTRFSGKKIKFDGREIKKIS
jgi:membrane-associated phospholipid phosphatase